jgi:putrescine transport system substrate-binding protein
LWRFASGSLHVILPRLHGQDPSPDPEDIVAAVDMLLKIRPFIRLFDSGGYLNSLPNQDICMAMTWSGDYAVASGRAAEAGLDVELAYIIPKEGTNIWYDGMLIPADAPHPGNAHLFLNYMMRPEVIAEATNYIWYANANAKAGEFVDPEILADPAVYPSSEVLARGFPSVVRSPEMQRVVTEQWTRLKSGG